MDTTTNNTDSQDEAYRNLDLDTAEQLLIAAGKPELATALYHQAQGVRNLVQGEWGKSFVNSLEGLLTKHIQPLETGQAGILAVVEETQRGLGELSLQLGDQGRTLAAVVGDVSNLKEVAGDLRTDVDAMYERLVVVEQTPGTYPDLLQGMLRLEKAVKDISQQSDRRQLYLLISIGAIVLLVLVLYALQITQP